MLGQRVSICSASGNRHAFTSRWAVAIPTPRRNVLCYVSEPQQSSMENEDDEEFQGLTEEEDWVVPGTNMGSLSLNTDLGKAVDGACDELEHLAGLETDLLQEADDILKQFGFKSSILKTPETKTSNEETEQK